MDILSVLNIFILIFAVGINLILATFVYKNNPRSSTNLLLATLCSITSAWLIITYISLSPLAASNYLLWIRFSIFLAVPQVILFFLLAHTLPREKIGLSRAWLFVLLIVGIGTMFLTLSPYAFSEVRIISGSPQPIPGEGIGFFAITTILISGLAIYTLIAKFRKAEGLLREQYRYVMAGMIFMLSLIITTVLIPVILFQINLFVAFVPLYTLVFLGMTTYAIVKHRLMDVRFVVARTVSFTLLIGIFALLYALLFANLSSFFVDEPLDAQTIIVSALLALLMAFSFPFVKRLLEKVTDKMLYKNSYEANKLLYELTLIMASTIRLEDVTHELLSELITHMRISRGAFILVEKDRIYEVAHEGYSATPDFDEEQLLYLVNQNKLLIFEELEEGKIKDSMRQFDFTVAMPLHTEGQTIGLLTIGKKLSGDIYTEEDIRILEIITPEAAVAIQNAKAYEEIRRFNITLQEEVDKATSDLQNANARLQELDKLKDEFVSLASHELRTPMTAIKGSLSTILDGYAGDVAPQAKEFLTAAYNENDRLIRLVNNLLNISRIEAGRFTFTITRVDLTKLIHEIIGNLQMSAAEKQLTLKFEPIGTLPPVWADEDKIREVFINLIGNALKFTHKGGVTVRVAVKDAMVISEVCDTGSGISKEDQDLLFKKFSQVQGKNYAKQTGGTGLGLYISKQIVEGLKGRIWIESELGVGSSFKFSLPIAT